MPDRYFAISFEYENILYSGIMQVMDDRQPPTYYRVILNNRFEGDLIFVWQWQMDMHPEWLEILSYFAEAWWQ